MVRVQSIRPNPSDLTGNASFGEVDAKAQVKCSRCNDTGFISSEDGRHARRCDCAEQRRVERLLAAGCITPALKEKTFAAFRRDGLPHSVAMMAGCAEAYLKGFDAIRRTNQNWLVLLGQPGCGKTHLAMAVANALIASGRPVLYFPHVEGMGELKELLRTGEGKFQAKLRAIKEVAVLVWDDLWKYIRPFDIEIAFEVLNYRYLNLLPTMISSEKSPESLLSVDQATASRILERGKGHTAVVEGVEANYRLKS